MPRSSDRTTGLRIGVIGCGGSGDVHMRGLVTMRESDNFDIAAVCDIYERNLQRAAGSDRRQDL